MDIAEAARRLCLADVDDDLLDRAKELNRLAALRAKPHVRPRARAREHDASVPQTTMY